jgi:hypothetical protein
LGIPQDIGTASPAASADRNSLERYRTLGDEDMTILLKEGSENAEDAFGVSRDRASELFSYIFEAFEGMENPTEDLLKIRTKCVDDQEFAYVLLHYGTMSGMEMAKHRHENPIDFLKKLVGRN